MNTRHTVIVASLLLSFCGAGLAVTVSPDEQIEANQWAASRLAGDANTPIISPGLTVQANNDTPRKNTRGTTPLTLGKTAFSRGIFCHAISTIVVRLPSAGQTFSAVAGVDSNEQTSGGRGSVVFAVRVGGQDAFRSGVIKEGMPPVPVKADLRGATEFTLEVGDGGDGIGCDQADWADAKITLADGKELWLADLPMLMQNRGPLTGEPPFSFVYGGKPSASLLKEWKLTRTTEKLDAGRTRHTALWQDPQTGLNVRCTGIQYHDFPTVEWTVYFKNTGTSDTPIIENIQALDLRIRRGGVGDFLLHHAIGSPANGSDYGPLETPLGSGVKKRIAAAGGRPTNSDMSYVNLESSGEGTIIVVGWPGQWAAEFQRDAADGVQIRAGQELTRFKLLPGEEVRSPMIVLQFWRGDWVRSQNIWRRWMMAYGMPKPGGKLPQPQFLASSSRAYEEMIGANEQNQIMHINRYLEEGLKLDYWWMDAGWYVQEKGWPQVGTWEVDPKRFPKGLRPISDHAHAKDVKILVWFEPERVHSDTWLTKNHPEWILGGRNGGLLNLGNPQAWEWLVNHIDKLITEQGIDLYRQDFNMDPLSFWRGNDAPDRQGITEIRHVTGYLAYWDELLRRHPNMLIDSCASGGRRNDLETMRRAVPLWRSDYAYEPIGHQCMTYGLSYWIPFHGTGTVASTKVGYYGGGWTPVEPYAFWSNAAPSLGSGVDIRVKDIDYAALRKLLQQWRSIGSYYYGDFYPLTTWTRDNRDWMVWQFDCPDKGEGMVQAFRRDRSIFEVGRMPLCGLDAGARYEFRNLSMEQSFQMTGKEAMDLGPRIEIATRPGASVVVYKRLGGN